MTAGASRDRSAWESIRRFSSRIWIRLLAFNVLLVFLPAAGLLYLNTYERQMLAAQEREMVQQGRLLAAALAAPEEIDAWYAERVLLRLHRRHQARLRVLDAQGNLLADSSVLGPKREGPSKGGTAPVAKPRQDLLYRLGALPFRLYRKLAGRRTSVAGGDYYSGAKRFAGDEVRAALAGRYGATTRISEGQRSVTLYAAIPIRWESEILGAVLVSQSTLAILQMLDEVRLDILRVVLASVLAAIVLSLLVSMTIAWPLTRLRSEALQIVDERGRLQRSFVGSRRRDEIGELSRALEEITERLRGHVEFIESFASDVSHELKNPLASIRSATELLGEVDDAADRQRMIAIVKREVARMERLLTGVREVAHLDASSPEDFEVIDLMGLLRGAVESARLRADDRVRLSLRGDGEHRVRGSSERLNQVFANLLDNACSFSPPGGEIEVEVKAESQSVVVSVADVGPGIPDEHRERVFDRFFTFRPDSPNGKGHVGLGLAIARAIARRHGGEIEVGDQRPQGAHLVVSLPRFDDVEAH